ncbi:MAG: hypothetical protein ACOY3I_06080 [Verrucomicrobiota bacterium]
MDREEEIQLVENILRFFAENSPLGFSEELINKKIDELFSFRQRNNPNEPDIAIFEREVAFFHPQGQHPIVGSYDRVGPCYLFLAVDDSTGCGALAHFDTLVRTEDALENILDTVRATRKPNQKSHIEIDIAGGMEESAFWGVEADSEEQLEDMKKYLKPQKDVKIRSIRFNSEYNPPTMGYNALTRELDRDFEPRNLGPDALLRYGFSIFQPLMEERELGAPQKDKNLLPIYNGIEEVNILKEQFGEKGFQKHFAGRMRVWSRDHQWARDFLSHYYQFPDDKEKAYQHASAFLIRQRTEGKKSLRTP